jgi:hypothetical protein
VADVAVVIDSGSADKHVDPVSINGFEFLDGSCSGIVYS